MSMGFDINIDADVNESDFRGGIAEVAEKRFREIIETEIQKGHIECDCGSDSFDIETWKNAGGQLSGAAVCRECNERIGLDIDTSDIEDLR